MERNCDNCAYKVDESVDGNGERIIDCEANECQMYAPWAPECKHWAPKPITAEE